MVNMAAKEQGQVQIRLFTKQTSIGLPDIPLSVPIGITSKSLNDLVNEMLRENTNKIGIIELDFIVANQLLRVPLLEFLTENNISTETTVEIEYVERTPAPEPQTSLLHDDWVCSVKTNGKFILTGCYDYSINIWTTHGTPVTSSKEHGNIVKYVAWLNPSDPYAGFVSVSHDLSGILWEWGADKNNPAPIIALKGHERGIDCVAVSPNRSNLATAGWDTMLKIWSSSLLVDEDAEPLQKRLKSTNNSLVVRTPLHTLKSHKETISECVWTDDSTICTVSMDHTIKFWDCHLYGMKSEIVGEKAYLGASWSFLNKTLLACSADRHIRLYDPRSTEGSVCKTTFTSHTLWVSRVRWCDYNENLFVSSGYDSAVKMWDVRSPKASLYDLQGHEGQVLDVDWSNSKYLVSGGCDNSVHIFKNKDIC